MQHKLALFCLFALQSVSLSSIVQLPAVLKVFRGETVSLTCDTTEVFSKCDSVFWLKVDRRSGEMNMTPAVHTNQSRSLCTGFIYNTSAADAGIYYCSVKHSFISYMGNGSTVIVTERHSRPIVMLYTSDPGVGPSVSLQCVVTGVVPAEVSVFWVVGESEMTGWRESDWTHTNHSAEEYTRAHISVSSEIWMKAQNVECVVEVEGRRVSKSVKKSPWQLCSWLIPLCSAVALIVIIVFIVTLSFLKWRRCCLRTRSTESRFNQQNGGRRRTERFSTTFCTRIVHVKAQSAGMATSSLQQQKPQQQKKKIKTNVTNKVHETAVS
ncbi:uncharacterized protein LOC132842705 isoform X2 [Tachysurus vachellii]|uniref:uncharacterized protein LOC132842705 isoform X2 n=1 Tax=Tachysurus vachellii TaxID=175792 RepID=UPI00296AE1A4|nr:uncharacterized protein LOC132842705 isoform X2 [Tachysurus vachellii]